MVDGGSSNLGIYQFSRRYNTQDHSVFGNGPLNFVTSWDFLEQLSACCLINYVLTPWNSVILVQHFRDFNYVFCKCTSTKELESV
jgi:hypothetical protein